MCAVQLTGHGGPERLEYRTDAPVPTLRPGEVLIRVAAAGVNNTDINTRIGWYSKSVTSATETTDLTGDSADRAVDGGWSGTPLEFPRIQGADCCGHVVATGEGVDIGRVGERVLVRSCLLGYSGDKPFAAQWLGSECDGAFAQYTRVPAVDAFAVTSDWSDAELASIPCAWSTAENLLERSRVGAGDRVLITGASGGVGSAAAQLARCRAAEVVAVTSAAKAEWVRELGASQVVDRNDDLESTLGHGSVDVVIDLVFGGAFPALLRLLRTGGRYATAGAIAGPIAELDARTLYLNDLTLFGCTWQGPNIFRQLVDRIEQGQVRPVVSQTYALEEIARAQQDFQAKRFPGKLVLLPPEPAESPH